MGNLKLYARRDLKTFGKHRQKKAFYAGSLSSLCSQRHLDPNQFAVHHAHNISPSETLHGLYQDKYRGTQSSSVVFCNYKHGKTGKIKPSSKQQQIQKFRKLYFLYRDARMFFL